MSTNLGQFVWYDVMTSDSKAAESFYRSAIGWDAKDSGMIDRTYTLFFAGPMMVGELMPIPE
jgi:predicted enzyme related to lactoylglutathione lyase